MKILILSDSHSKDISDIDFNKYDYIFHLGDYGYSKEILDSYENIIYVSGNCDFLGQKEIIKEINNKKMYMTHGHLYNVKYHYNSLIYKALSIDANICLFGHTHRNEYFVQDDIIFINPGAYNDGYYVIIDDNNISYYRYDKIIKNIEFKW